MECTNQARTKRSYGLGSCWNVRPFIQLSNHSTSERQAIMGISRYAYSRLSVAIPMCPPRIGNVRTAFGNDRLKVFPALPARDKYQLILKDAEGRKALTHRRRRVPTTIPIAASNVKDDGSGTVAVPSVNAGEKPRSTTYSSPNVTSTTKPLLALIPPVLLLF